ncbi:SDR family NAD(P)-dependent oxidoreductase [Celeribacter sp. ULVN23_4]
MADTTFGPRGWTPDRLGTLASKTYVITGTTTGTGFEATRVLLSKGAKVVMLNRNGTSSAAAIAKLKEEFGPAADVSFIHMDLSMMSSVRHAAATVLETVPQIDALICNAAISQIAKQEITIDGFESHLGVNHYGHFLLCSLLFERVEESSGRIVIVGSMGYNLGLKRIKFEDLNFDEGYNAWNPYAHSKLAIMMFGYELQRRAAAVGSSVNVQICHPGAARTDLIKGENLNRTIKLLWAIFAPIIGQSAEKGSWPLVLCATEKGLKPQALYGPTQRGNLGGAIGQCELKPHVLDEEACAKLWAVSEEQLGIDWPLKHDLEDMKHA